MQKPQKFPPPAVGAQQEVQIQYIPIDLQNRAEGAKIFGDFDFKLKPPFILKPPPLVCPRF